MAAHPRLAVGTLRQGVDGREMVWALLDALEQQGIRVQTFRAKACFDAVEGDSLITGLLPRHLDTWLMSPAHCQALVRHAFNKCDLALVQGQFSSVEDENAADRGDGGGRLETLCDWLDLPRLAIVDLANPDPCRLPARLEGLVGVLLDSVPCRGEFWNWQTTIEGLWGVPVLGALEALPDVRSALARVRFGEKPDRALLRALGESFLRWGRVDQLARLAERPALEPGVEWPLLRRRQRGRLRVAVALDEAFSCYFPDTLDTLELCGADVRDFSPLRCDRLPDQTDIVYFGCGHPERHLEALHELQQDIELLRPLLHGAVDELENRGQSPPKRLKYV